MHQPAQESLHVSGLSSMAYLGEDPLHGPVWVGFPWAGFSWVGFSCLPSTAAGTVAAASAGSSRETALIGPTSACWKGLPGAQACGAKRRHREPAGGDAAGSYTDSVDLRSRADSIPYQ